VPRQGCRGDDLALPGGARGGLRKLGEPDHADRSHDARDYQRSATIREPSGGLESGLVASLTGSVRFAIVSGGVARLVGAVAVTLALPMLWHYDARTRPPDAASPGPGPPGPGPSGPAPPGPAPVIVTDLPLDPAETRSRS
jgi:hypothetical protein